MPIAFVIDATGRHDVAAVLALHGDRNAFVDPDGRWLAEHYVPAYLRRFPFCSFVHGAAAQTNAPIVCVQEARSEEHTSELQSLMRISYAVFCLKKTTNQQKTNNKLLIQHKTEPT